MKHDTNQKDMEMYSREKTGKQRTDIKDSQGPTEVFWTLTEQERGGERERDFRTGKPKTKKEIIVLGSFTSIYNLLHKPEKVPANGLELFYSA